MLNNFDELEELVMGQSEPQKIAVIKAASEETLESVFELADQNILVPYLIDEKEKLETLLSQMNLTDRTYHIIDAETDEEAAFKGVQLARENDVQLIMKGDIQSGTLLKQVVNRESGIRKQDVLSHISLLDTPNYPRLLAVTDGGMFLTPDVNQKAAIIENALEVMKALSYEKPKFAILSAAEVVQPKLQASVEADELTKRFSTDQRCVVEGPISLDIALYPEIASAKNFPGKIQGDADVIVTPDIIAGNTLSKSIIYLANGKMAGLIVGAKVPIILTSRVSTKEEKRYSLLLALQMSHSASK